MDTHNVTNGGDADGRAVWRGLPLAQRYAGFDDICVLHPNFEAVLNEAERRLTRVIERGVGEAFSVYATSGGGKTTLANALIERLSERFIGQQEAPQSIVLQLPAKPTNYSMSRVVLEKLSDPGLRKRKNNELNGVMTDFLERRKVRLVIIDNFHDIVDKRSKLGSREITNWVRDLHGTSKLLVVLLGEPAMNIVKGANRQIKRRAPRNDEIGYFDVSTKEDFKAFARFVLAFEKRLPLAEGSNLKEPKFILRLFIATNGIQHFVGQLFLEAFELAVKAGRESLQTSDFIAAYELVYGKTPGPANPFSSDATLERMDKPGQFFHNWMQDDVD